MDKTRRVKVVTGLKCNSQCVFCYYRDNLQAPNRTKPEIEKDLRYAYRHGVRQVDFSGGEPTVHPDLPALIATAKRMGMDRVCIISNGMRLAKPEYARTLKEAGLDEVLFSMHGSHPGIHDEITQVEGSFERLRRAMAHIAEAGLDLRVNTVVNRLNYVDLDQLSDMILGYQPVQCNFIALNDWCFAKHLIQKFMMPYAEMAPSLKSACDRLAPHVAAVNVRYIPFCFMHGYERFVCDHRQILYDPYEWVPRVRCRLEVQNSLPRYLSILAYGYFVAGSWKQTGRMAWADLLDDCVVEGLRKHFYCKGPQCSSCALYELCDGVENTYQAVYGVHDLIPVAGTPYRDPLLFRRSAGR